MERLQASISAMDARLDEIVRRLDQVSRAVQDGAWSTLANDVRQHISALDTGARTVLAALAREVERLGQRQDVTRQEIAELGSRVIGRSPSTTRSRSNPYRR